MSWNRITFQLSVPIEVRPDDVGYVTHCPALDVYSQGDTEQDALDILNEALRLFVESCYLAGHAGAGSQGLRFQARYRS